jgi:type I restriction enzyme S subunit
VSEWREIIFSEIADFSYGTMPRKEKIGQGIYPTFSGYKYQDKYPDFNCEQGDLIVVARGVGGTGDVKIVREKCYLTNLSIKINVNKGRLSNKYFYYLFAKNTLRYLDSGSAQSQITINDLEKIILTLPSIEEQKAIASVLSCLDDKIDLLHRQNKTLEAMAETLFRQWFVEEAQENWDITKLGDCVTINYGKNLPTKNLLTKGFPVFGANGQIGFYERYTYESPQVLVSCRGEASGKVNISLPKSFITNNSLILERNKKPEISFEFLKYWALSYDFNLHVSGSAQPQITIDGLYDAEFIFPDVETISSFTYAVKPVEEKRYANTLQIRTLETLRDTLLPKLMNGEVRVDYP